MFRVAAESEQALQREKTNWENAFTVADTRYQNVHGVYTTNINNLVHQLQSIDGNIHSTWAAYTGMITSAATQTQDDLTFAAENVYGHWMTKIPKFPPSQYLYAPPETAGQGTASGIEPTQGATLFIDQIAILLGQWKADQDRVLTHVLPLQSLTDGGDNNDANRMVENDDAKGREGVSSNAKTLVDAIGVRIQQVSAYTQELELHKNKIASTASEDPSLALASSYKTLIQEKITFFEVQTKLIRCYSELWLHFQSLKYLVLAHVHKAHLAKLQLSVQHKSLVDELAKKPLLVEQWRKAHAIVDRFTNEYRRLQDHQVKLVSTQETIYAQLLHKVKQQQQVILKLLDDLSRSARVSIAEELPDSEHNMQFAAQLAVLDMFLQLIDVADGSDYRDPDTGSKCNLGNGPINFRFHQLIRGKLLHPKYRSRGFFDKSAPGMGKTGGGLCGILEWVKYACEDITRDRHSLVLLPNDRAFVTWHEEILKMINPAFYTVKHTRVLGSHANVTHNCHRITITQHTLESTDDESVQKVQLHAPFILTFQVVLYSLPIKVANEYAALANQAPEWDLPFEMYSGNDAPMYAAQYLPDASVRRLLESKNATTIAAVKQIIRSNKVAVPSRGLVIVDEIHLLIDPIAEVYTQSHKTLAWIRKIRVSSGIKLYAATGTLAMKNAKAMNVIRTLALWKKPDQARVPNGVYRASLSSADKLQKNSPLLLAYQAADHAEVAYLEDKFRKNRLHANDEAAAILEFQQLYTGIMCHAALDRDPMMFPQVDSKGVEMNVPFVLTSDPHNSNVWVLNKKRDDVVTVDGWKWVYLPNTGGSGAAQFAPVKEVKESSWKKINSVELLIPMQTQQFRDFQKAVQKDAATGPPKAGDCEYCLDYTNYKLATSIYKVQFSQLREKLDVLEQWITFHPENKHAAFTDIQHIQSVRAHAQKFAARYNYEIWGISKVIAEITKILKDIEEDPLPGVQLADANTPEILQEQYFEAILERIYENMQQGSSDIRRMLYFGNDDTKEKLKAQLAKMQAISGCPFTMDFDFCGRMLFRLWNHYDNGFGKYFALLLGDRSFRVGFSLLDTKFFYFLEPPANPTDARQRADRIKRMCGMPARADPKDWSIHVVVMINTVPLQYQKVENLRPGGGGGASGSSNHDADGRVAQIRKTVEGILPAISMTSEEYQFNALSQNVRIDILDWMVEALNDVAVDKVLLQGASSDALTLSVDHTGTCAISSSASSYPQEISTNEAVFHLHELADETVTFSIQKKEHQVNARELKAYCQQKEGQFQMAPVMLRNQALLLLCIYHLQRHNYADGVVGKVVMETILADFAQDASALLAEVSPAAQRQHGAFSLEIPLEEISQRVPLGAAKLLFDVLRGSATDGFESEIIFLPWTLSPPQRALIMRFLMMRWYNLDVSYKNKMIQLVRGLLEYTKDEMSMEESQDELTQLYQAMKLDTDALENEATVFADAHVANFPVNPNISTIWKNDKYTKYNESMLRASAVADGVLYANEVPPFPATMGNGEVTPRQKIKGGLRKQLVSASSSSSSSSSKRVIPSANVSSSLPSRIAAPQRTSASPVAVAEQKAGIQRQTAKGSKSLPCFVPELFTYVDGDSTDDDDDEDEQGRQGGRTKSNGKIPPPLLLSGTTKTHTLSTSTSGFPKSNSGQEDESEDESDEDDASDEDDENTTSNSMTDEKENKAKNKIIKMPATTKKRRTRMKGPF